MNIINFITFIVIVIGSTSLFIVLSGFAGLKTFSLSYTTIFDPDLKASPSTGKVFSITPEQENKLSHIQGIVSFSKELEERVSLTHKGKNHFAYIKGVDRDYTKTTEMDSALIYGNWSLEDQQGVAGIGITHKLGLSLNVPVACSFIAKLTMSLEFGNLEIILSTSSQITIPVYLASLKSERREW